MSTPPRQFANAANTQLSTGPPTEAGKAQSAQNARKHGPTAPELLIPFEDREEFDALHANDETEIRPQRDLQRTLFEELVASAWNPPWIRRMETQLCSTAKSYSELLDNAEIQTRLDRLGRHKGRIERTFHRSPREFKSAHFAKRTQSPRSNALTPITLREKLKALQTNDAPASSTRHPPAPTTDIARFAKRTQSPPSKAVASHYDGSTTSATQHLRQPSRNRHRPIQKRFDIQLHALQVYLNKAPKASSFSPRATPTPRPGRFQRAGRQSGKLSGTGGSVSKSCGRCCRPDSHSPYNPWYVSI